jgi:putative ABC transport system permease protein
MTASAAAAAIRARVPAAEGPTRRLLRHVSWREWWHHPWRHLAALAAVAMGVALAFSVHLINESALGEFSAAVRQVNAQPDLQLRGPREGFDESLYTRAAMHPSVTLASPVLEIDTYLVGDSGQRTAVRVIGVDAFIAPLLAPALLMQPDPGAPRLAMLDPGAAWLNPAARAAFTRGTPASNAVPPAPAQAPADAAAESAGDAAPRLQLQSGSRVVEWTVRGEVPLDGPPTVVADIAGVQAAFDRLGRISRIDLRLAPGTDAAALLSALELPRDVQAGRPDDATQRVSNLSRAYRVNLTVLALVALFTGAFLVFSVLALSVAKRLPQLALLGVLGLSARERRRLILAESALLGLAGSAAGLVLGTALAALALRWLAGDLGGAYFPGVRPALHFDVGAAVIYGGLGLVAALLGGWMPARTAERMPPAQALKGLGLHPDDTLPDPAAQRHRQRKRALGQLVGPALLLLGVGLAFAPPIAGLPLAAYVSVAALLVGGIACVPPVVALLLARVQPTRRPLVLLAVTRARHERHAATIAVAGVVASLSLAVALTVMVSSFRGSILEWLDAVLPADLYARTASGSAAADAVFLEPELVEAAARLPGVGRVEAVRLAQVSFDPRRPAVVIIARPMDDPARQLPLIGDLARQPDPVPSGAPGDTVALPIFVSEAMVRLYGARPGTRIALPLPGGGTVPAWVRGVWRDYVRQHGAVVIDAAAFRRLTGDTRVNDLAFWLAPGTDPATIQAAMRRLAPQATLDFATPGEIRAASLRIFDRSFAVTYWLQAVAIAFGLFGIAASFSAQVMARRKEFGLLRHLGLTRREVLGIVAAEGAVWSAAGAVLGVVLGLAVSLVLVHVVNPQSFNWTMPLRPPWDRLGLLAAAVVVAGTLTAWWAGRAAGRRDLALAVKEDW